MKILKLNSFGWDVILLNLYLDLGPWPYFTPGTVSAVKAFQKTNGLKVDGEVGPLTLKALKLKPAAKNMPLPLHKDWMAIALLLEGTKEDPRPGEDNPLITKFHKSTKVRNTSDETPWCSSFVNHAITESGREGTNDALAMS